MSKKYPDACGTCYIDGKGRIVGVREGFNGVRFIGYVDGMGRQKRHNELKVSYERELAHVCQQVLDVFAKEEGWRVAE